MHVTGSRGSRATAGSETGTSAVRGILSKINPFCNGKESSPRSRHVPSSELRFRDIFRGSKCAVEPPALVE
jgi:hypothetical protein